MNEMIYLSLGYPIGFLFDNKQDRFHVELNGEAKQLKEKISFVIWSRFLGGEEFKNIKADILEEEKISEEDFQNVLENLISENLILKVEENIELMVNNLKDKKIIRQGYAIDRDKENDKYYVVMQEKVELNTFEYTLWILGDGKTTVLEIIRNLNKGENKELGLYTILNSLISLYYKGLLYII